LILFGSRARGDYSPDSDYDCLVIVDEVTSWMKDRIDEIAAHFLLEYGVIIAMIPVTQAMYQQQLYEPLFMNVRREGIVW
jgi:predicted nucleotidyltransferase